MVRHNNVLPNGHFHKKWQEMVRTWFDQPARKLRRRQARADKAGRIFPRPVEGLLRPAVRCQTLKYNSRLRTGRGFSLEELKAAGIRKREARKIGIAVDHRRKNRSNESLDMNVQRLKSYKSRLILFPKKAGKPKKADTTDDATLKGVKQLKTAILPIKTPRVHHPLTAIKEEDKKKRVFFTLRRSRADIRLVGVRSKKAAEKAANEALTKKD
jgi:large subunit ribosomal protein L13e